MIFERDRQKLVELLRERSFEKREVTLASGKKSNFYIDVKQAALTSEGHRLLANLLTYHIPGKLCQAVAGVELGGCSLASAVSMHTNYPALYIRKERKERGMKKLIEGDKSMFPGIRVVLLEDVITTGGSSLKAVEALRQAGADVTKIIAVVDRLEGGSGHIESSCGVRVDSLTTKDDFIEGDEEKGSV